MQPRDRVDQGAKNTIGTMPSGKHGRPRKLELPARRHSLSVSQIEIKRIEDGTIRCHRGRFGVLVALEYSGRKSLLGVSSGGLGGSATYAHRIKAQGQGGWSSDQGTARTGAAPLLCSHADSVTCGRVPCKTGRPLSGLSAVPSRRK